MSERLEALEQAVGQIAQALNSVVEELRSVKEEVKKLEQSNGRKRPDKLRVSNFAVALRPSAKKGRAVLVFEKGKDSSIALVIEPEDWEKIKEWVDSRIEATIAESGKGVRSNGNGKGKGSKGGGKARKAKVEVAEGYENALEDEEVE
ncbi:hypothetical protein [Geoglobus sp.]